jgi:hypothetical protein
MNKTQKRHRWRLPTIYLRTLPWFITEADNSQRIPLVQRHLTGWAGSASDLGSISANQRIAFSAACCERSR